MLTISINIQIHARDSIQLHETRRPAPATADRRNTSISTPAPPTQKVLDRQLEFARSKTPPSPRSPRRKYTSQFPPISKMYDDNPHTYAGHGDMQARNPTSRASPARLRCPSADDDLHLKQNESQYARRKTCAVGGEMCSLMGTSDLLDGEQHAHGNEHASRHGSCEEVLKGCWLCCEGLVSDRSYLRNIPIEDPLEKQVLMCSMQIHTMMSITGH